MSHRVGRAKELLRPNATAAEETRVARLASLLMKVGALGFALELNRTFSINLQLLGGIWILQTFPAVMVGLYTRWFHRIALDHRLDRGDGLRNDPGVPDARRRPGTLRRLRDSGVGPRHLAALVLNLAVSAGLTVLFRKIGLQDGYDEIRPADYAADPVTVRPVTAETRIPRYSVIR